MESFLVWKYNYVYYLCVVHSSFDEGKSFNTSVLVCLFLAFILLVYSNKPSKDSQWKENKVLAVNKQDKSEKVVMQSKISSGIKREYERRIVKKTQLNNYLNWCEEIYDKNKLDGNWEVYEDFSF
ncbi:hypothetical protein ACE193_13140 [Bernardetia sp. OM2101]|uniref:hypothetical protein n=1 Tax=Bernardetia sp. OM2101 TaxID=3344876 RepID=UPI0035D01B43